jgi:hypothetical protein
MRKKLIVLGLVVVFLLATAAPAMAFFVSRPYISGVVIRNGMATPYGYVYPRPANYQTAWRLYLRVYQQNAAETVWTPIGVKGAQWTRTTSSRVYYKARPFSFKNDLGNIRVRAVLQRLSDGKYWMSAYKYVHVQDYY